MKNYFLLVISLGSLPILQAMDSIGLHELPSLLFGQATKPEITAYIGPTFSWYRLAKSTVKDVENNPDQLRNTHAKMVPGFCVGIAMHQYDIMLKDRTVPFHYGLTVSYAHRNKALKSDYYDAGQTTPLFFAQQDVRDFRVTPYAAVSYALGTHICHGASVGFGIGVKTLNNLKLYEKATNAYIGQKLKAASMSFLGEFSYFLTAKISDFTRWKVGYNFTLGKSRYKRNVVIEDANAAAPLRFINQAFFTDKQFINLAKKPKMRLRCHRLELSFQKDF